MKTLAIHCAAASLLATAAACAQAQDITLGAVLSLTGPSAVIGEDQRRGMELAIEHVNAAGGVLGRRLRVIVEDSGNRVPTALDAAKKLAVIDKTPVVIGEYASGLTIPMAQYLLQEGVVHLNIGSSSPRVRTALGLGSFTLIGLDDAAAKFAASDVYAQGFRHAAVISGNNVSGQGVVAEFTKAFEALGGTVAAQLLYTGGQSSYRRELQQLARATPDIYVYSAYGQEAAILNREAFNLGLHATPWYAMYHTMGTSDTPADIANDQIGMEVASSVGANGQAYEDAYVKKYNEKPTSAFGSYAYDAVQLVAEAIQEAGSADADKLRAVLGTRGRTFTGVTGEIVFDPDGQRVVAAYQPTRYQNGVIPR